jgi:exosortase A-associated hydrolase 1
MRRLLTFSCQGAALGASLDEAEGATGILFVTGGSQTRIGSHRLFERLGRAFAEAGHPAFRYDRRGVGDSEGEDPGWRGGAADMAAAAEAFRSECPKVERIVGVGLCDGASALALYGRAAGLDGLIFLNPWLVESEAGEPPAAAIRQHYKMQLTSRAGWKKLLSGSVSYVKFLRGLGKIAAPPKSELAGEIAAALDRAKLPVELILASRDATAVAAQHELGRPAFEGLVGRTVQSILTDSHTFARPGDLEALLAACLAALGRLSGRG